MMTRPVACSARLLVRDVEVHEEANDVVFELVQQILSPACGSGAPLQVGADEAACGGKQAPRAGFFRSGPEKLRERLPGAVSPRARASPAARLASRGRSRMDAADGL